MAYQPSPEGLTRLLIGVLIFAYFYEVWRCTQPELTVQEKGRKAIQEQRQLLEKRNV